MFMLYIRMIASELLGEARKEIASFQKLLSSSVAASSSNSFTKRRAHSPSIASKTSFDGGQIAADQKGVEPEIPELICNKNCEIFLCTYVCTCT